MHEDIVKKWNSKISKEDIVYNLGDFIFNDKWMPQDLISRLNYKELHLIRGNHDHSQTLKKFGNHITSVALFADININNQDISLCHYPLRSWKGSYRGAWNLHGHTHGRLPPIGKQLDVGVDSHNFSPWSFDEIKEYMKLRTMARLETDGIKDDEEFEKT